MPTPQRPEPGASRPSVTTSSKLLGANQQKSVPINRSMKPGTDNTRALLAELPVRAERAANMSALGATMRSWTNAI